MENIISFPNSNRNLQETIDEAPEYAKIIIAKGFYALPEPIFIDKPIRIMGETGSPHDVSLYPYGIDCDCNGRDSSVDSVINIISDMVLLWGCSLGCEIRYGCQHGCKNQNNCRKWNTHIGGINGVRVEGSKNVLISNCDISCNNTGLIISDSTVSVRNCEISFNYCGINTMYGGFGIVNSCEISENDVGIRTSGIRSNATFINCCFEESQ